jgi:CheY-like chemotaxis protein
MTEKIILFINSDSTFYAQTSAMLQNAGYSTRPAGQMREALSVLSNSAVGLIICDRQLQDISGLELLNFIKKDPLRESIPFMFLVSSKEQGDAFKAFELGAADYYVYPLDSEMLIDKVDDVFAATGLENAFADNTVKPEAAASAAAPSAVELPDPLDVPGLNIEVSRDGIIWIPGKIVRFGRQRLFIDTALFGKAGVSLMVRINMAEGTFVLNGFIKQITFNDFQNPASIEMSTQEEDAWRRIHAHLLLLVQAGDSERCDACPGASPELEKTIVLDPAGTGRNAYQTGSFHPSPPRGPSYDRRYYYSIIGRQLDNYRAITLIGSGSMGGVIQGWDVALEREVALKVISYELSSKEKFREMFVKEARVVSRLNHLNIAQIYYIGTSNDILYYAMEFVDGHTLKDLLDRQGHLKTLKGVEYLITVCDALHYVHQNSIIHRDMKPANIMLNHAGVIKILDFGVAITGESGKKSEKNQIIGSPMYMSPEQVAGLTLDSRSDIYSVGATFYHVFTGAPPFEAKDYKDIMSQHIEKPLPPMKEKNPRIPAALARIIEKMMAKDPLDRYADFRCVADDVKALLAHAQRQRAQK